LHGKPRNDDDDDDDDDAAEAEFLYTHRSSEAIKESIKWSAAQQRIGRWRSEYRCAQ